MYSIATKFGIMCLCQNIYENCKRIEISPQDSHLLVDGCKHLYNLQYFEEVDLLVDGCKHGGLALLLNQLLLHLIIMILKIM